MEYPKRLQNLNLQELAFVFEIPYETMFRVTSQKKELHARDIPVIVTYGDLMRMALLSMKAAEKMLNVTKGEAEPASLVEITGDMIDMFNYIFDVLDEGNIEQEKVKELFGIE